MTRRKETAVVVSCGLLLLMTGGCELGDDASSTGEPSTSVTDYRSVGETVPLAAPAPGLNQDCQDAAGSLGFAVPCPDSLPLIAGEPIDCRRSCVATSGGGDTLDTIFFLNVEGYDGELLSDTTRHLIVEARRVERAPPKPCYDGASAGQFETNGRTVMLLDCPPSSPEAEAAIVHGEGAHTGHLLGYWDEGGVRYVASVHGSTEPDRALLRRLVSSIEMIEP